MKLELTILDYAMNIGNTEDKIYLDPDTQEQVVVESSMNRASFGLGVYDGDKTAYANAIEAHLISIGIADAEAKSIAKLAKDLAKNLP